MLHLLLNIVQTYYTERSSKSQEITRNKAEYVTLFGVKTPCLSGLQGIKYDG